MNDTVIRVENLSKRYLIGHQAAGRGDGLRHVLQEAVSAPWRALKRAGRGKREDGSSGSPSSISQLPSSRSSSEEFWALKDVSFEVKRGEVVGIIGRNGAGKSTLLKILSRITEPNSGRIEIDGRVASLLEVGTGFHPELTGRENIFLNGAILGMTKAEIKRKFDEIVDFSGVEQFLDTPVKRYSSGMYVRLAFAVAAHLEPEILIVDEVLAVGDAQFQKKCLGKMKDVAGHGRTILFVSHNMVAVRNLCSRSIWLQDGQLAQDGVTSSVVDAYLQDSVRVESIADINECIKRLPTDPVFKLEEISIRQDGKQRTVFMNSRPIEIKFRYKAFQRATGLRVYFDLLDEDQNILVRSFNDEHSQAMPTVDIGEYVSTAIIPPNILAPRRYELRLQGTIFNVRSCTGQGIVFPLLVETATGVNRAYPEEPIRARLQPTIIWENVRANGAL